MNERINVARKGTIISSLEQISGYVLSFISRRIIIICIGVDYLGLNSTLTQMIGALSVTELGLQSVIIYRLYKPVVEGDKDKICELMSVIRIFYRIIAAIISAGSVMLLPFLKYLINDINIPWSQIYFAWLMMAISAALSYTMNYNSTIIFADRKQYIYQGIHLLINFAMVSLNLILLFYLHSYNLYLIINILNTFLGNVILLLLRRKLYPWVRFVGTTWEMIREVVSSTLSVFSGRICAYIFNSTDSIVISALISTSLVGYVGNYSTVTMAVMYFITNLCGPIQAIIGNMLVVENKSFLPGFIKKYTYVLYVIGSVLIIPTALLLEDFVTILYGEQYILGKEVLYLLIAYIYLCMLQSATGSILDADGQFRIEKHFYLLASIINIILSIIGACIYGVDGVLLGTVIGSIYLLFCRIYYCYKVVVNNTKKDMHAYIIYILWITMVFIALLVLLHISFDYLFSEVSIVIFCIKGVISVVAIVLIQVLLFRRTTEYQYVLELSGIKNIQNKLSNK